MVAASSSLTTIGKQTPWLLESVEVAAELAVVELGGASPPVRLTDPLSLVSARADRLLHTTF